MSSSFNNQLPHTTLKNVELLKHFKISKTAPTCFGLQGNHHQGATISTLLKITHLVKSRYVEAVQDVVSVMAAYCDCNKTIYMEYVNKKLRSIKTILDKSDITFIQNSFNRSQFFIYVLLIQGVPGGICETSGECSLC